MLGLRQTSISNDKITLIGMMGTGKSKFGRLVAKNLNFNFYDIDTLIENKFKTSIKNLFMKYGEPFFRNIEAKTIKKLIANIRKKNEKVVISIGGGAFDYKETRELLHVGPLADYGRFCGAKCLNFAKECAALRVNCDQGKSFI